MRHLLFAMFLIWIMSGCSLTTYTKPISKGMIENRDIVITAVDKSFTLQGEFYAPFQSNLQYNSLKMPDSDLLKSYKDAQYRGAKRVRIKIPGIENELYGILALDKADQDGIGPGTESYKIIIPEPYIKAAKNGKISVVYEYYKLRNDGLIDISKIKERSWILWFSDQDVLQ